MEGLGNINEKFMDNFPEYITYPERKRLVDADKVRFGAIISAYLLRKTLLCAFQFILPLQLTIINLMYTIILGTPLSLGL